MATRIRRRSSFGFAMFAMLFLAITAYFAWQSTRGAFSTEARTELAQERAEKQALLAELEGKRQALERRVKRFRADRYEADLLDERARAELFVAKPDELVLFHDPVSQLPDTVLALGAHGRRNERSVAD